MDGKSSCKAKNPGELAPHTINLFDGKEKRLVGQEPCEEGKGSGGERAAAVRLLKKTDLKGALVTCDAGFASGGLPKKIKAAGADYLLKIKENLPSLREHMRLKLRQRGGKEGKKAEETVPTGGRLDERQITVLPASLLGKMLPEGLSDAKTFGVLRKISTHKKTGETTETLQYFISSMENASPEFLLKTHRQHWRVENDLHRTKDLYMREDDSRLRNGNAPQTWAALRSFCLAILQKISPNLPEAMDICAANPAMFFQTVT
jgi:predicted transposase YbfD/YdcC